MRYMVCIRKPIELTKMYRLVALIHTADEPQMVAGSRALVPRRIVMGLATEFIQRYWEMKRCLGCARLATDDAHANGLDWADLPNAQTFEIDGPNGEYIVQVGAALSETEGWSAIEVRTNWGRSTRFGQEGVEMQYTQSVETGEVVSCFNALFVPRRVDGGIVSSSLMLLSLNAAADSLYKIQHSLSALSIDARKIDNVENIVTVECGRMSNCRGSRT